MSGPQHPEDAFFAIKERCLREFRSQELWPCYYERRYLEFLSLYEYLPKKRYVKILELGCGVGYYSAFLSLIADEVIATDLEVIDPATHSPGLNITRDFLRKHGISNVTVMHASAEDLPFADESFDLVFSSHVIEHVPDMNKAISEISRVLKKGGHNFCVVPTATDRLHAVPAFYFYLIRRAFSKLFRSKEKSNGPEERSGSVAIPGKSAWREQLKHFPFPAPHGVYSHYFVELWKWRLGKWKQILCQDKRMKFHSQRGLQTNIFFPFLASTFPKTAVRFYAFSRPSENRISSNLLLRYWGISTLIITEKK